MRKCPTCRKHDVLDSWWDKTKEWMIYTLFPKAIMDIREEKYTQGFGDGYKTGFDHANKNIEREKKLADEIGLPDIKDLYPEYDPKAEI